MEPSADLAKVGRESFALLEECVGRKTRPVNQNHVPQHQFQYAATQGYNPSVEIDCNEAAKMYGGVVITDYRAKKPLNIPTTRYNGFSREMNCPPPNISIIRKEFTVATYNF
ncbi:hypothetical protein Pint_00940 [Pistacia integerrima]|uniref:Uncharacterized protein n=1 Tax=Pistacia integerrima TaxID=434235 RepID=A0ACC0ZFL6_9ROSI|nr:hypothetical protein Pint_00940 [Pistacia integerrima]